MKARINVTATDIRKGERNAITRCPVALATKRLLTHRGHNPHLLVVGNMHVDIAEDESSHFVIVPLPDMVKQWIRRYDARRKVAPFSFTIDLPFERKRK